MTDRSAAAGVLWACSNCLYWDKNTEISEDFSAPMGYCRANPPIISATKYSPAKFPITDADGWCGRFDEDPLAGA